MPALSSVFLWLAKYPEFSEQYDKAAMNRATAMFEEMLEIADDGTADVTEDGRVQPEVVQRSRLRVDTRKWALARMNPRKYGERVAVEASGPGGGPIAVVSTDMSPEDAAKAWAAMLDGSNS